MIFGFRSGLYVRPFADPIKGTTDIDADELIVGDNLCTFENGVVQSAKITAINQQIKQGKFAPLTSSGTILVDGILCSCYARISEGYVAYSHYTAHLLCLPMRCLFSMNSENCYLQCLSKLYIFGLITFNRILKKFADKINLRFLSN